MALGFPEPFRPELIDNIVDFLHDDKEALLACGLTSKTFRLSAIRHIFAFLTLTSRYQHKDFD
jgi:hypothetical protein